MRERFAIHNRFKEKLSDFIDQDPHLLALSKLTYQHFSDWWKNIPDHAHGIYILTGGRQVGKSTSVKLWIAHCLKKKIFSSEQILYLPCDEIFDAPEFSQIIRDFLKTVEKQHFLLAIDEVTFVKNWERVIKSLADEGCFTKGLCLLTGSDTLILKEAAISFPGRRGTNDKTDFHVRPLSFPEYVSLVHKKGIPSQAILSRLFDDYLQCGGYLRAINDFAKHGSVQPATYQTYEQWIRGDFLKRGKNEKYLLSILHALFTVGVSQISYSALTQKVGNMSKETCSEYCELLERMDILFDLQAFDQNKKIGFPKKARKFHFADPFIQRTVFHWLHNEGYLADRDFEAGLVEACVASHCHRFAKTFYFKGQGEVDVVYMDHHIVHAVEVKWSEHIRPSDLKTLKDFKNAVIVTRSEHTGTIDGISAMPVFRFLMQFAKA